MALIDRMKEYWHQGSSSTAPPSASGRGSKTYTMSLQLADCGYQSFDDLIPQHRQLIPVDPAGSPCQRARTPLLCQLHLPRAGGERFAVPGIQADADGVRSPVLDVAIHQLPLLVAD